MKCHYCGAEMVPAHPNSRYCSDECNLNRKRAQYAKWAEKHPERQHTSHYKKRVRWTHEVVSCHKRVSVLWPGCAEPDCVSITMFKTWTDIPAGTVVMLDGKLWNKPYRVTKKEAKG